MKTKIKERVKSGFDGINIEEVRENRTKFQVKSESVLSLLGFLKDNGYDHLELISCVDRIEEDEFELVYLLNSYMKEDESYRDKEKETIILKTRLSREDPRAATAIPIFPIAEPYERELHEMFGIHFEGHPNLTSLFLETEYELPPYRKDFDSEKFVKEEIESIPEVED